MNFSIQVARTVLVLAIALSGCSKSENATKEQGEKHADYAGDTHDEHEEGEGHAENLVRLDADAQRRIKLAVSEVTIRPLDRTLTTTGEFEANADRLAHVTTRMPARVTRIFKTVGDLVQAGEAMATLESLELGQAQSEFLEAQANHALAKSTLERQRKLFRSDLAPQKEVLAAETQLRVAEITLEKSKNRLKLYGYTPERIASLTKSRQIDPTVPLASPINGVVVAKALTLGEMLSPDMKEHAFTVSDTSDLWVDATLYEKDMPQVSVGQAADVTASVYPGKTYRGRVALISPELNKETRTARARIVVPNPSAKLKPEMFASVRIAVSKQEMLALPQSALIQEKEATFAFVQTGPETFEKRPIKLGGKASAYYPVLSGLTPGEKVVTEGSFTLKAESVKESFGEHEH